MFMLPIIAGTLLQLPSEATPVPLPPPCLSSWQRNTGGRYGSGGEPDHCGPLTSVPADVQHVWYDSSWVYIDYTDIPDYTIGPWVENGDNCAFRQGAFGVSARFPRNPRAALASDRTSTGTGAIGLWIDGTFIYDAKDAHSYIHSVGGDSGEPNPPVGDGIWNRDANGPDAGSFRGEWHSFDAANGHPDGANAYHFHRRPASLQAQVGDTGNFQQIGGRRVPTRHSPILGWARDGFPIYGPYAYTNANGLGGSVTTMRSGYRLRSSPGAYHRNVLPDGTGLPIHLWGPPVDADYPLGRYVEDYEYAPEPGDLDECNGRVCITPEFPEGIYAYFITIDPATGDPEYPYIVGPKFYGRVSGALLGNAVPVLRSEYTGIFGYP